MGVMNMMGWELGEVESIAVVANIGLAVDYIVHLAADYTHSREPSRHDKMRQAYRQMGVSILSGAITTMGCGLLLVACQISFFKKFGTFICLTIAFSLFTAALTFGGIIHICGPEKGFGDIIKQKKVEAAK